LGWIILIWLIALAVLAAIGLKFPIPHVFWPLTRRQTLKMLAGVMIFLFFLVVFKILKNEFGPFSWNNIIYFGGFIIFALLFIIGIFFPKGIDTS